MSVDTAAPEDRLALDLYKGKKVKIKYRKFGTGKETAAEGTIEEAGEKAVLFRAKGKTSGELIIPSDLLEIALDDSKPADIKQKTLKDPNLNTARQHLADRHGWSLADVNELDEETALRTHAELDHGPLSHTHDFIVDAEKDADGEPDDEDNEDDDLEDEDDEDDDED